MATREEIMEKLIDASLSSSPKVTLEFEIDGAGSPIEEINGVILKILQLHEGLREVNIKVKL